MIDKMTCYMIVPLFTVNLQHIFELKIKIKTVKWGWATGTLSFWICRSRMSK